MKVWNWAAIGLVCLSGSPRSDFSVAFCRTHEHEGGGGPDAVPAVLVLVSVRALHRACLLAQLPRRAQCAATDARHAIPLHHQALPLRLSTARLRENRQGEGEGSSFSFPSPFRPHFSITYFQNATRPHFDCPILLYGSFSIASIFSHPFSKFLRL